MSRGAQQEEDKIPNTIVNPYTGSSFSKLRFFGKGGFARCFELQDTRSRDIFAGKIVSKRLLVKGDQKAKMAQEIEIHKSLSHRNVVKFYSYFEDASHVYMLLELCRKRSMMELHKRRGRLTEPEVRYFIKQILEGVQYLHGLQLVHRDLKLGNLFLNDNLVVKIGDFGLAARIQFNGQRKKTLCGTPNYIAPEILLKKGHSYEVDIWSIGCIMYTLLIGNPPFETDSLKETYSKIKRCDYYLPQSLSNATANMVHQMLLPEPSERPTVAQLLKMEFLTNGFCPKELPASCLTMAPHFETITETRSTRRPLVEVNNIGDNQRKIEPKQSIFASGSATIPSSVTGSQCVKYLYELCQQLESVISKIPKIIKEEDAEDISDPAAQPFVWVSKWVDYSDKYGFGYQLCDDGFGVMFNDNTKIILLPNERNVHYIEKDGTENYYTIGSTPPELNKKMKLLQYFKKYMMLHLSKAGAGVACRESDSMARLPCLHLWNRTSNAVIMQLSNGTVQINFMDHAKIIMCPLMQAVTYIDQTRNFRTFRFATLTKEGCPSLLFEHLSYACKKLQGLIKNGGV